MEIQNLSYNEINFKLLVALHTILNVDVPKCDVRNITNKIQDVSHCTYLNLYHSAEK